MTFSGVAHVALTVTSLERSKEWYGRVLGWEEVMGGEGDGVAFAVGAVPGGTLVGLRQYDNGGAGGFDPTRIGLDHLALNVTSASELAEWERTFTELRVDFDPSQETPYGHVLNFKDPDGIALEIYAAPAGQGS